MSLPHAVDQSIKDRFHTLKVDGEKLIAQMAAEDNRLHTSSSVYYIGEYNVCVSEFHAFRTRVLTLIGYLGTDGPVMKRFEEEVGRSASKVSHIQHVVGVLGGLADAYANGFLDSIVRHAEAEIVADYLGQAERLLGEGGSRKYDHVPAAVLLGAVLEKSLRTLCERQTPQIPLSKGNGEPKTLGALIDDLKAARVFNELKAKHLRAWADIRNAAAHARFDDFGREEVAGMQAGVATFLADHM